MESKYLQDREISLESDFVPLEFIYAANETRMLKLF